MKTLLKRSFFLLVGFVLTGICMVWFGYCTSHHRFISQSEARDAAAIYAMKLTQVYIRKDSRFVVPDRPLPYASLEEFMRENPDCCALSSRAAMGFSEVFDRATGNSFAHFDVRYKVRFLDDAGYVQKNDQSVSVYVTNCAEVYSAP